MARQTKVIHRKLGKERAWGLAFADNNEIHIDSRLKGKKYITICIHELLHVYFPEWSENKVNEISKRMAADLWSLKLRKTDI